MKRLQVGRKEAVDVLVAKMQGLLRRIDDSTASRRLHHAVDHAVTRHQQVRTVDNRGFYHGLITGYAVAMKVLQGKVGGRR
ncbi:MAG TPA: hypothetical protein VJT32_11600 [bacterium]|nr:hypothetical protein [bacterium]